MNFPKENHAKKRMNSCTSHANLKQASQFPWQISTLIQSKGKIRIQQYEYEEDSLIGYGYTSRVYLGRLVNDPKTTFAIKVVDKKNLSKNRQNLQLLKQEVLVHKQLDHPNIVKCYDIIEKNNNYYFILEYCPHGTLDTLIKTHQKLTEAVTITIMEQIISAYKYLLSLKVLHRDLKPPNILRCGNNWKICDFGFSVMGKKNLVGQINVGTPAYMAPQALQRTFYSPKTDFFSLGVLCYEMLFGETPWHHKNQKILLQMIKQQKIKEELLSSLNSKHLVNFILRCCESNQKRRMNLQQFEGFSFWKENSLDPTIKKQRNGDRYLSLNKTISSINIRHNSIGCNSQTTNNTSLNNSGASDKSIPDGQLFKGHSAIIERDFYYSTLIYYLIKNYSYLLFQEAEEKELFVTVLGRHAGYIIRRMKHEKVNYLNLKQWRQYCASEDYRKFKQYAISLEGKLKEKLNVELKQKTITTIRQVNKKFDDLNYDQNMSVFCLSNLKDYLFELMQKTIKRYENAGENYATQNLWTVQVLDYLLQYYKYVREILHGVESSRVMAVIKEYKDRSYLIEDFSTSTLGSEYFQSLTQQIRSLKI